MSKKGERSLGVKQGDTDESTAIVQDILDGLTEWTVRPFRKSRRVAAPETAGLPRYCIRCGTDEPGRHWVSFENVWYCADCSPIEPLVWQEPPWVSRLPEGVSPDEVLADLAPRAR